MELEHPKIKAVDYESMKGKLRLEVYYESIKREPKIRGMYECRCDERLQTKTKEFTRLPYTQVKFICSRINTLIIMIHLGFF